MYCFLLSVLETCIYLIVSVGLVVVRISLAVIVHHLLMENGSCVGTSTTVSLGVGRTGKKRELFCC